MDKDYKSKNNYEESSTGVNLCRDLVSLLEENEGQKKKDKFLSPKIRSGAQPISNLFLPPDIPFVASQPLIHPNINFNEDSSSVISGFINGGKKTQPKMERKRGERSQRNGSRKSKSRERSKRKNN